MAAALLSELATLRRLDLSDNAIETLPDDLFAGTPLIGDVGLERNELSDLPAGIFVGVTRVGVRGWLSLLENPGTPFPLLVSPETAPGGRVRLVVPTGTPVPLTFTVHVVGGGTIAGGSSATLRVEAGARSSDYVEVARTAGRRDEIVVELREGELPTQALGSQTSYTVSGLELRCAVVDCRSGTVFPRVPVATVVPARAGEETESLPFPVSLDAASAVDLSLEWEAGGATDTASGGEDYTLAGGTLTIAAGATAGTIVLPIVNDDLDERNETVTVRLVDPAGATVTTEGSIVDDDEAGLVLPRALELTEGASIGYAVALSAQPRGAVEVAIGATGDVTLSDQVLAFAPASWSDGQTVTVTSVDNRTLGDATATLTHTVSGGGFGYDELAPVETAVTIRDDEMPSLSIADVSVGEDASAAVLTVTVSPATSDEVTVTQARIERIARDSGAVIDDTEVGGDFWVRIYFLPPVNRFAEADLVAMGGALRFGDRDLVTITGGTVRDFNVRIINGSSVLFLRVAVAPGAQTVTVRVPSDAVPGGTLPAQVTYTAVPPLLVELSTTAVEPVQSRFVVTVTFSHDMSFDADEYGLWRVNLVDDFEITGGRYSNFDTRVVSSRKAEISITPRDTPGMLTLTLPGASVATGPDNDVWNDDVSLTLRAGPYRVGFGASSYMGIEGGAAVEVPVVLEPAASVAVRVPLATTLAGGADAGDYSGVPAYLDFAVGESEKTIVVTVEDDDELGEDDTEGVTIGFGALPGTAPGKVAKEGVTEAAVAFVDNAFELRIDPLSLEATVGEGDGTMTLEVTAAAPPGLDSGAGFRWDGLVLAGAPGGDAIVGQDHPPLPLDLAALDAGGHIRTTSAFAPDAGCGCLKAGYAITVPVVLDDSRVEGDETLYLTPSATTGAVAYWADDTDLTVRIADDDEPEWEVSLGKSEIAEEDTSGTPDDEQATTLTLGLAHGVSFADAQTLTLTTGGTATQGVDYLLAPVDADTVAGGHQVVMAAGAPSVAVTVTGIDDAVSEPDETVVLAAEYGADAYAVGSIGAAQTLTLRDTDGLPEVTVDGASASVLEGEGVVFTVRLSHASSGEVTVRYSTADGTAAAGTDYTAVTDEVLTIAPGATSATLTVATLEDTVGEPEETFTVTLSDPSANAELGSAKTATGTIEDGDGIPTLIIGDASAEEGEGVAFTVTLSHASSDAVTVQYTTADGTATAGTDYTAASGEVLTIASGATSATLTVATTEDPVDEPDETFTVTLSDPSPNAELGSENMATGTIEDDDAIPALSIADASALEGEGVVFTVSLSHASSDEVTVQYTTADGTAGSSDYTAVTNQVLTIASGATSATLTIATTEDPEDEPEETFTVKLSDPSTSAELGAAITATGTIVDDDGISTLRIADASAGEGEGVVFTVSLSHAVADEVIVKYTTGDDTATAGTDYTAASGEVLTIASGATSATLTIATTEDPVDEPDETFNVTLSDPSPNAELGSENMATGTIVDGNATPTLTIADASASEGEGVVFTVSLSHASSGEVTVEYTTGDDTASAGTDYTAASGETLIIASGATSATLTIATADDLVDEPDETFTVTLSDPSPNAELGSAKTAAGTIEDDDTAGVTVSEPALTVTEEDTSGGTYTVVLDSEPTATVTVTVAGHAGTDVTPVPTSLNFTASDWDTMQTVTVTAGADDDIVDDSVVLTHAAASADTNYGAIPIAGVTVTIVDDDEPPPTSIVDVSIASDPGSDATYQVGDAIRTTVAFDDDVTVTGAPRLTLGVGTPVLVLLGIADRHADYVTGSGTAQLVFQYMVVAGDNDPDGVSIAADSLSLNGGSIVAGDGRAASLLHEEVAAQSGHRVDTVAPSVSDAFVERSELTIRYTEVLDESSVPDASQFDVHVEGALRAVSGVAVSGKFVTLTLSSAVQPGERVTAGYTVPGVNPLRDPVGLLAPAFADRALTNYTLPTVSIAAVDPSVDEGIEVDFTLQRTGPVTGDLDVQVQVDDSGDVLDEPAGNRQVTFAAGDSTVWLTLATMDDHDYEAHAEVTATVGGAGDYYVSSTSGSASVEVLDNDLPDLEVVLEGLESVAEDGGEYTVLVRASTALDEAPHGGMTVRLATEDGTAVSGADGDFEAIAESIRFGIEDFERVETGDAARYVATAEQSVPIHDDAASEGDETFELQLTRPGVVTSTVTLPASPHVVTIVDDEAAPTLSIANASAVEGESVVFTVSLSHASSNAVTVQYSTADDTADSSDYTEVTNQELAISPGATSATLTIATTEDPVDEPDETFTVTLSNPSASAELGTPTTATGTIEDDDATPTLTIADASASEGEGVVFTVSLSHASSGEVTVEYSTADETATSGTDYTAASGETLTIAPGTTSATLTIATTEDMVEEPDETFTVTLSDPSSNAELGTPTTAAGTIVDDDGIPTLSIADASASEGEGVVFTVSLSHQAADAVTVQYTTADDTATAGTDYTAATNQTLTISSGATSATLTIATTQDTMDEPDETFTVTLSGSSSNAELGTPTTAAGTIVDDDGIPTLSIANASAEEGAGVVFTVSLSHPAADAVTVQYTTADDTATAGTDYTAASGATLTIGAGATSATLTIATTDDLVDEPDETFTVTLSNPSTNAELGSAKTATGTIEDNDATPPPTLSITDASASEGADVVFTVSLSHASSDAVTVQYTTADDTATAGTDYTAASGETLTIGAGATSATLTVATADDLVDEPDESFTVTLSNPSSNAELGSAKTATGTIEDDDATPTLSIANTSAVEGESVVFTVSLSHESSNAVTVQYSTADDTATAGTDYTAASGATLTIGAGATSATLTIATADDLVDEPDETFTVTLSNPSTNAELGTPTTATGTIVDDDGIPTLRIVNASAEEGTNVVFTVSLSHPAADAVTVQYTTADDTATAGTDYTAASGATLTIGAGATSATLTIATADDLVDEPDETFTVTLSNPSTNAELGTPTTATGTIVDDDGIPTLRIVNASAEEGTNVVFTVSLSHPAADAVTVQYTTADDTATAGTDYTAASGATLTIGAGATSATLTIATADDLVDEPDETFTVTLSNPSSNAELGSAKTATGTIEDNDATPTPTLSIADASASEGADVVFTVSLSHPAADAVTVQYSTADDTATAGTDYTAATNQTLTIGAGATSATLTIATANDLVDEPDESFTVTLSNPSTNAELGSAKTATGTIEDNDATPTLSIANTSAVEGESVVFTVSLSHESSGEVTVQYTTADDTATAGTDYTAASGATLTIGAGDTSATLTITTTQDTIDEPDETFTVTLASPSTNAELGSAKTATGTIEDNDATPTLSIANTSAVEGESVVFTVSLSHESSNAVTVQYSTADNTATAGTDYTAATNQPLTISSGATSATLTITTTQDTMDEPDETFTVTLSGPSSNAELGTPTTATGTIIDDDGIPTLSIANASAEEGEDVVFTVSLSHPAADAVTVQYSTTDGTATAGTDYTGVTNQVLTITSGATSAMLTIATTEDTVDEPDETFTVTLSGPSTNAELGSAKMATGTIEDNDETPTPTLSIANASAVEGEGVVFTVSLSHPAADAVTVRYSTADDTATAGTDYTALTNQTLTIMSGATSATLAIATADDLVDEPDETFTVTLSNPSTNAELGTPTTATGTIVDDDGIPTLSIADASAVEGESVVFTVSLSHPAADEVTVQYSTSSGTATAGTDYTAMTNQVLTITSGATSATLTIATTEDAVDEPDETFTVTLSNPSTNAELGSAKTATGTIEDNDATPTPTLSITDASASEGADVVFTVSPSHPTADAVTVQYSTGDVSATSGTDYTAASGETLTIGAGATSATLTIATADDLVDEPDETFTVTLSNPSTNAELGSAKTATGTIEDNDATPTPTLSIADSSASEGEGVVFTVSLSHASSDAVTVQYTTADDTATGGTDYTAASGETLIIAPGATSATLTIATADDLVDEPDESFTVTLSNPSSNAELGSAKTATGRIEDNDATPTLTIADASASEGEGVVFRVSLSHVSSGEVTVQYTTADDTATAGTDYTAASGETLTIGAGATSATLTIATTEDTVDEPDETFTVTLASPSTNAELGSAKTATGTIEDNDATPTLSIANTSAVEGESVVFTVSLSHESSGEVTVQYATADDTATAGTDYTAASGAALTIGAGDTSTTLTIATTQDTMDEHDETFTVTLSNPSSNAELGTPTTATGTIVDDDGIPTLSIANASAEEGEDVVFTVSLSHPAADAVTVQYSTTDGTATAGTDYTGVTNQVLTITSGATSAMLTIATTEDTVDEPDETFTVTLSGPSTNAELGSAKTATGTIEDNDETPTPTLSIANASAEEGESVVFTVSLSDPAADAVTVQYSTADDTATAGTDYTAASGATLTITSGATSATLTIATSEDPVDEPDETFTVTLSDPSSNAALGSAKTATGTIEDNDATPTLSIANASAVEGESVVFTVSLSHASSDAVTVQYSTGDVTATAGTDYTAATNQTLTISSGATSATLTIATTQDTMDEADETFMVTLASPSTNAELGSAKTATGTIEDDDATPTLSIANASAVEGESVVFTVSLSHESSGEVTVQYSTADDTATAGTDYTAATNQTLTISSGATSATLTIATTQDTMDEADETFMVTLASPSTNAELGSAKTATGTIEDNDATPTLSIANASAVEGENVVFTVSLSHASSDAVTVQYTTADDTATAGTDYTAATNQTLTISSGATSATLTIATTEDTVDEPDETFTVTLASPSTNAELGSAKTATGTIEDNDATPTLSIANTSAVEGEGVVFTVSLSHASSDAVTVQYSTGDVTATAGTDYTAATNQTLTISSGATIATLTIATTEDTVDEPDETFTVTLSDPSSNAELGSAKTATGTIEDGDGIPTLIIGDASAGEGEGVAFTLTLSHASSDAVTVQYTTADGTATAGTDYTAASGETLTIGAGDTSTTLTIATTQDTMDEPDETFTVTLSNPSSNAELGTPTTATGTIVDDDGIPTLSIANASAEEGEDVVFTVSLSHPAADAVTLQYSTADGTATAGTDYTGVTNQVLTITSGATSATLTIATTEDAVDEPDETFTVTLSNPSSNAELGSAKTATGTIEDDDATPTLSIANANAVEGESVVFTVSLSHESSGEVTVQYTTADDTATAGTDYTAMTNQVLTITSGATSATLTIATIQDTVDEPDETFTVTLSNPSTNAELGSAKTATGTIEDNDATPTLSIANASAVEGESVVFTVSLSHASSNAVTVQYSTADNTATAGTDYTAATNQPLTISSGATSATLTITTTQDTMDEPDETFTVTLSGPSTNAELGSAKTATGTIEDNDATPTLSIANTSAVEGEGVVFTVSLSHASSDAVTVQYSTGDVTATAGTDYTAATNQTLTISSGATIATLTIATTEDTVDEPDETFTVTLASPSTNAELGSAKTATGTIEDNDETPTPTLSPTLSIADASAAEGEGVAFTVSLSSPLPDAVTVRYDTNSGTLTTGTATAGTDYTAAVNQTLSIAAGATSGTITIATTDDTASEDDETFTVTLSSPSTNAELGTPTAATGTIVDDDRTDGTVAPSGTVWLTSAAVGSMEPYAREASVELCWDAGSPIPPGSDVVIEARVRLFWIYPEPFGPWTAVARGDDFTPCGDGAAGVGLERAGLLRGTALTLEIRIRRGTEVLAVSPQLELQAPNADTAALNATLSEPVDEENGHVLDPPTGPFVMELSFTDPDVHALTAEAVMGLEAEDFEVTNATVTVEAWNGSTYKVAVTPITLGEPVTVRLPAGSVLGVGEGLTADGANTYTRPNAASNLIATDTGVPDHLPQTIAQPLTARFEAKPASHDGATPFSLRIAFSDAVTTTAAAMRDHVVQVSGGAATAAAPVDGRSDLWEITIQPGSGADVTVTVAPGGTCGETGTVCTADGQALANGLLALVAGPGSADTRSAPLTARFEDVPAEHDGAGKLTLRLAFSAALRISYRTLRDEALAASGGTVTNAARVDGRSDLWTITVEPSGVGAVTLTLPASVPCGETGAVCTADGRALSNPVSATIVGPPGLSVADAETEEAPGAVLAFAVTLDRAASSAVTVDWATADGTAAAGEDYAAASGTLTFDAGVTAGTVSVAVLDDAHDEGRETLTLALSNPSGAWIDDGVATGTIINTDPIPQAWIARFGRTVADQVLDAVRGRMTASRRPGTELSLAGQRVGAGTAALDGLEAGEVEARPDAYPDRHRVDGLEDGPAVDSRAIAGRELLTGSSFALTGGSAETGFGALWGRGAITRFDAREDALELDGEVASVLLGVDLTRGRGTAGLALAHSRGDGAYRSSSGAGEVEGTLTGLYPWGRYEVNDRLSVWGVAGYGAGTLTLTREGTAPIETGLALATGAVGAHGLMVKAPAEGGLELAARSDAMLVRTASTELRESTGILAASEADVTRLRLGLEGTWRGLETGGRTFVPTLELGVRHDGGDAETGFGVEVGAGFSWTDTARRVKAELRARGLLTHEAEGFRERGLAGSFSWDPDPSSDLGPSFLLRRTVGASATGGMDALLRPENVGLPGAADDDGEGPDRRHLEATFGYGFSLFEGRYTGTPTLGLGYSDTHRETTLGWRLGEARRAGLVFGLDLEGQRREHTSGDAEPEHRLGLGLGWRREGASRSAFAFGLEAARLEAGIDTASPGHRVGLRLTARW